MAQGRKRKFKVILSFGYIPDSIWPIGKLCKHSSVTPFPKTLCAGANLFKKSEKLYCDSSVFVEYKRISEYVRLVN